MIKRCKVCGKVFFLDEDIIFTNVDRDNVCDECFNKMFITSDNTKTESDKKIN